MGGDGMGWVGMGGDGWLWVGEGGQDANDDWQELLPVYVHVKSKDPETHPSPPIDPEPVLFANQINMTSLLCLFNSQKSLRQRHAAATLCKFPSTLTYQFRQQHAFSRGY